jgi:hypothetical protein
LTEAAATAAHGATSAAAHPTTTTTTSASPEGRECDRRTDHHGKQHHPSGES